MKQTYVRILRSLFCSLIAVIVIALAGCASPPDQLKEDVNTRLDQAVEDGFDRLFREEYEAARDTFAAATAEIAKQADASSLSRSYDLAERRLAFADSVLAAIADSAASPNQISANTFDSIKAVATAVLDSAVSESNLLKDRHAENPDFMDARRKLADYTLRLGKANKALVDKQYIEADLYYRNVIEGATEVRERLRGLK